VNLLILVVDDEPDVEVLFRQQFRQRITDAAGAPIIMILSDINMPGMSGLELLPKAKAMRPDVPIITLIACTRECRMIGNLVLYAEPAKPAILEVHLHDTTTASIASAPFSRACRLVSASA
jgi:DNA-binding LytR/AlgR family response regulator